jgi:DNA-binding LytR/AlgR family response regulator
MENGKERKCTIKESMASLEQHLPKGFFRCNPRAIINLCYFREYRYVKKVIVMENGMEFPVSRRKLRLFRSKLPGLSPLRDPSLVSTQNSNIKDSFCSRTWGK